MLSNLEQIVEQENESESEIEKVLENHSQLLKDKECGHKQHELAEVYGWNTRIDLPSDISDEDDAQIGSVEHQANRRKKRQGLLNKQKTKQARLFKEKTDAEVNSASTKAGEVYFQSFMYCDYQIEKDYHSKVRPDCELQKKAEEAHQIDQTFIFQQKREKIRKARFAREQEDEFVKNHADFQQQKDILSNLPKLSQVQPAHLKGNNYYQQEDLERQEQIKLQCKKEVRNVSKKTESIYVNVLDYLYHKVKKQSTKKGQQEKKPAQNHWGDEEEVKQARKQQQQLDEILQIINNFEAEINKDEVWNELEEISQHFNGNESEREVNRFLGLPKSSSKSNCKQTKPLKLVNNAKELRNYSKQEPQQIKQEYNQTKYQQLPKKVVLRQETQNQIIQHWKDPEINPREVSRISQEIQEANNIKGKRQVLPVLKERMQ